MSIVGEYTNLQVGEYMNMFNFHDKSIGSNLEFNTRLIFYFEGI